MVTGSAGNAIQSFRKNEETCADTYYTLQAVEILKNRFTYSIDVAVSTATDQVKFRQYVYIVGKSVVVPTYHQDENRYVTDKGIGVCLNDVHARPCLQVNRLFFFLLLFPFLAFPVKYIIHIYIYP